MATSMLGSTWMEAQSPALVWAGSKPGLRALRLAASVWAARSVTSLVRLSRLGAASVLPGRIACRLEPEALPLLLGQVKRGVILVVGTNGKTTTSHLLRGMLEQQGFRVVHNGSGANLLHGLVTALLEQCDAFGRLEADYAVLEVDENVLPHVLRHCRPQLIVGLNLFRDQLDRYGEIDAIKGRWHRAIAQLPASTRVILNGDDPALCHLGQQLPQQVSYFGLSEPEAYLGEAPHAADSTHCPACGQHLDYEGVYLSHLGDYRCSGCGFARSALSVDSRRFSQVLAGLYNKYNTVAAGLAAQLLGVSEGAIEEAIRSFRPAFGRAEVLDKGGKRVKILLSKNPVALNETIRLVAETEARSSAPPVTLLALNARSADGTDVSWIWDVEVERLLALGGTVVVSGERAHDMALRLSYAASGKGTVIVDEHLQGAVRTALSLTAKGQTLHVLPTYTAMLEVRGLLVGRKIP